MTDTRICKIDSGDIATLIQLGELCNLSPWTAQNYRDELGNPHSIMLRLEGPDNQLIGFLVGRVIPAADLPESVDAEIYNIAVEDRFRRHGYAQTLLNAFIDRARSSQVRRIWLEVRESNAPAINFYKRNGFRTMTKRREFYSNPQEDALLMRLDLAAE